MGRRGNLHGMLVLASDHGIEPHSAMHGGQAGLAGPAAAPGEALPTFMQFIRRQRARLLDQSGQAA